MVLRKEDVRTAREQCWYRIPVKSAPEMVKSGALTTLALYQTKAFGDDKYTVRWWGDVESISIKKRVELLPKEEAHPRAEEPYYMIQMQKPLQELPKPIVSTIPRRNPFILTTRERLLGAKDFNDLFCGSPLEERLWSAFRAAGIPVQREFMVSRTVSKKKSFFYLDFALFCKDMNIAIECDGDTYHNAPEDIEYDKDRDVKIQNMRFVVYRFTTDKIINHFDETVQHIKQAIKTYGGVVDTLNPAKVVYMPTGRDLLGQHALFG